MYQPITIEIDHLDNDQLLFLLRSCETGRPDLRKPDWDPFEDGRHFDKLKDSGRQKRAYDAGSILAKEAWQRGLLSASSDRSDT